jgi:hypothetical protein
MEKSDIIEYFEKVAPYYAKRMKRNPYYHRKLQNFFKSAIPRYSTVLEIGTVTGDLLSFLKPKVGVGLCLHDTFRHISVSNHPELDFYNFEVDRVNFPENFKPEYIVMVNLLDFIYDLWDFFASTKKVIDEDTTIVFTTTNPLWKPILKFANFFHLKTPEFHRNFITNRDIISVLKLLGFNIVREDLLIFIPKYIPLISGILNFIVPELPFLRQICSTQYIIAKYPRNPKKLSCSVVVPCHNEEENIQECIRRIPTMGSTMEIIVVDDGSSDQTSEKVKEIQKKDNRVKLISYKPNRGKGYAVKTGFQSATSEVLMILDADMTVAPEDLPKFLTPLEEGKADFINGTRLIYPRAKESMKFLNFLGNKFFCFLISWIIGQRCSDTLCGTKALLKRDYLKIPMGSEKWGDFDLIFGAGKLNLRIWEIPVHYKERIKGKSKMNAFKEFFVFIKACWRGFKRLKWKE